MTIAKFGSLGTFLMALGLLQKLQWVHLGCYLECVCVCVSLRIFSLIMHGWRGINTNIPWILSDISHLM